MNVAGCATILVAEDDPDDQMLLRSAFRRLGIPYELRMVDNGEAVLEYLLGHDESTAEHAPRPDLILLDLNMPGKNGLEALAAIKALPEVQHIPVVILTTSTAVADRRRSYAAGANGYVAKPQSFGSFVELVAILTTYWLSVNERPPIVY